ncbi:MAG: 50S ribosomal protein L19 [Candidatus Magasanikbacteria bacterium CG_4_9_14_3_um_filter_32_9]|uniref:50S ribosomal protein L19 n=1 Tax=Candidatus Magasanikbacteria bacterium CG_4_9_14_3_um_filter_32_9 TaxID=1974644 RepID=A0A2M7Z690_9BACT|nr:MAG: 50S ribosomal protein L19 [Candidatus Magasanikbacteria bacterium CG_4_9_14_3_um_filter_32_9]
MSDDIRNKLRAGMIVKVHQKIKETNTKGEEKQRIQVFEGIVLALKHGTEAGATVTVRKISNGVGVEKIFPIHSPVVEKIELVRTMKVEQGRAYYLRTYRKKLKEVRTEQSKTSVKKDKVKEDAPIKEEPQTEVEKETEVK